MTVILNLQRKEIVIILVEKREVDNLLLFMQL